MEVLLIDNSPLILYGLSSCLEETGRFSVAGQIKTLTEAQRFIEKARFLPSLIILEILLNEEYRLDFLYFLKQYCLKNKILKPPVLICSSLSDPFRIRSVLEEGAAGFLPKTADKSELLRAVNTIISGDVYVNEEYSIKLKESSLLHAQFTKREMEILSLVKQNKPNRQIAEELFISIRTVENHISNIYTKTDLRTRQELLKL